MGIESTLICKSLQKEELRDEAVIDVHRCIAGVAIHVYVIVALDGKFFKAPPALQTVHAVASAAPAA